VFRLPGERCSCQHAEVPAIHSESVKKGLPRTKANQLLGKGFIDFREESPFMTGIVIV